MTFEAILLAALGGTVEAVTGKALEKGPVAARRARRAMSLVESQDLSEAEQAVRDAVDGARQELLNEYAYSDEALDEGDVQDLVALLNHPPFAEELATALLFRGGADFERLRSTYLQQGEDEGRSERWAALEPYLIELFASIEERLFNHSTLGPLLRDVQMLTTMTGMAADTHIIADASRQIQVYQKQIAADSARGADAGERTASAVERLLQSSEGQNARLNQFFHLLADALRRPEGAPGNRPAGLLTSDEIAYLRLLREKCNVLFLADEKRDPGVRGRRRAELANVYVDLQTDGPATLALIFSRLSVPPADVPKLLAKLKTNVQDADGRPVEPGSLDEQMVKVGQLLVNLPSRDFDEHPLRPHVSDAEELKRALESLTALEALEANQHLVLLGDPGSGKSTFVNHVAYVMAGALLGEQPTWAETLDEQFEIPLFPIRVILRRWSGTLTADDVAGLPLAYRALANATDLPVERIQERLGPNTLVLFDGIDEAPAADPDDENVLDRRQRVLDSIRAFCIAHPECRVLLTCRIKPYEQSDYRLHGVSDMTLKELDEPRITRFVNLWYEEMRSTGAFSLAKTNADRDQLLAALERREDLRTLAGTPLLLTMLAIVNATSGLPESRAELYEACVDQLLWEWEKRKQDEGGEEIQSLHDLLDEAGLKTADLERVLWEQTYAAHEASGADTADLKASDLEAALAQIHPKRHEGKAWASRVVALMSERSGLLIEGEPGVLTFPHRSFQEYLAARWLLEQESRPQDAAELAVQDNWREVILLTCGYATSKSRLNEVQQILFELLEKSDITTSDGRNRLLVAGTGWLEFDPGRAIGAIGDKLREQLPRSLTYLMQAREAPAVQRLDAGLILADLEILPDDLDEFVPISASKKLGYDFQIGKYPVTNAQFQHFIDAGGYEEKRPWWIDEEVKELDEFYGTTWREGPRLRNHHRFNRSTQPVVGVSWYEAVAYCAWLTGEWRTEGCINGSHEIRLPTEAEWAWVAAGKNEQTYVWGDEFESWRVNSKESDLNQTTPVHMYPGGRTPDRQVWDLCGNVWEWGHDDHRFGKILFGGSYVRDAGGVQASARDGYYYPGYGDLSYGFRCVVVPISRC